MDKQNDLTELQKLHQQQMKEKREAIKRRKARTHRLIVRGAIAEKLVPGAENMSDEQFQEELYAAIRKETIMPSHPQDPSGSITGKKLSSASYQQPSAERTSSRPTKHL